jgi:hypothetical protein
VTGSEERFRTLADAGFDPLRPGDYEHVTHCAVCGGRIHRNEVDAPWKHGRPKDHKPRPA